MGTPAKPGNKKPVPFSLPRPRKRCLSATSEPPDYQADEIEFMKAVDRYKREKNRSFPALSELLMVLRGLGWKKVKADE